MVEVPKIDSADSKLRTQVNKLANNVQEVMQDHPEVDTPHYGYCYPYAGIPTPQLLDRCQDNSQQPKKTLAITNRD